MPHYLTVAKL